LILKLLAINPHYSLIPLLIHLSQDLHLDELVVKNYCSIFMCLWFQTLVKYLSIEQIPVINTVPNPNRGRRVRFAALILYALFSNSLCKNSGYSYFLGKEGLTRTGGAAILSRNRPIANFSPTISIERRAIAQTKFPQTQLLRNIRFNLKIGMTGVELLPLT